MTRLHEALDIIWAAAEREEEIARSICRVSGDNTMFLPALRLHDLNANRLQAIGSQLADYLGVPRSVDTPESVGDVPDNSSGAADRSDGSPSVSDR